MSRGMSLAETLVALAILGGLLVVGVPAVASIRDGGRVGAAARHVASGFAAERWRAVARARTGGFHFAPSGGAWAWREVDDGNGNGLRTAEVRAGSDPARTPFRTLDRDVAGTVFGIPPGGPFPEAPPGAGTVREGEDPVRFGVSDLVSFSPDGSSSSGTLYLTDGKEGFCAVVLFGPTARVRVWTWDRRGRRWTL